MLKKIILPVGLVAVMSIFGFQSISKNEAKKVVADKNEKLVWHTNVKQAMKIANKEDKPLFLFFTGSDWCGWCMRLQSEVFRTPEFEAWAKEKVVLVELDFPRRTAQAEDIRNQNMQLQQVFAVQGYPTVWFAQAEEKDGKINFKQLGSNGYMAGGPKTWTGVADGIIARYVSLKKAKKK